MVFQHDHYTDDIHKEMENLFKVAPNVAHTRQQIAQELFKRLPWLSDDTEQERQTFSEVLATGIKKLIQLGIISQVHSRFSSDRQWMLATSIQGSGYIEITTIQQRATSQTAKHNVIHRALNAWDLNAFNKMA